MLFFDALKLTNVCSPCSPPWSLLSLYMDVRSCWIAHGVQTIFSFGSSESNIRFVIVFLASVYRLGRLFFYIRFTNQPTKIHQSYLVMSDMTLTWMQRVVELCMGRRQFSPLHLLFELNVRFFINIAAGDSRSCHPLSIDSPDL